MRFLAIIERQKPRDDLTATGGEWQEIARAIVVINPLTAREVFVASQVQSLATCRATLRGHLPIKPSDRLRIDERILEIESIVNVDEANRVMELLCVEEVR